MTSSFTELMARDLFSLYGQNMLGLQIIMPGGGAIPSLQEALKKEAAGKAMVLPQMMGIDAFVDAHVGLKRADSIKTLLVLYRAFRKHHNPEESLDSFFSLGQVLLADFDLILRAGKSPEQVFAGLKRWEETGASFADFMDEEQKLLMRNFSQLFRDNLQESRTRFLRLWENLPAVFAEMEASLLAEGKGTPGMVYREAARVILRSGMPQEKRFYFAGFSSLSALEISMMRQLASQGRADFAWDILPEFTRNPLHEVSRIFSRLKRVPEFQASLESWTAKCESTIKPAVREMACPGLSGMAQWILKADIPFQDSTAFILSDPAMIQLLAGRGKLASGRNLRFSMGYPLAYTPFARWMYKVLVWQARSKRSVCGAFIPLMEDSHFRRFFPETAHAAQAAFAGIDLPTEKAIRELPGIPSWLLIENPAEWLNAFLNWLTEISAFTGRDAWLLASVGKVKEICASLSEIAVFAGDDFNFPVLQAFLNAAFQSAALSLEKEDGPEWKAMGLFESRNLDFDRVIIAPGDEGLFPSGGKAQSLLPESVRKAFSLPLRNQVLEDQAYQFYRLCQRSKEVIFLSSDADGTRRSRFLDQIEFGGYFPYSREVVKFSSAIRLSPEIRIERSGEQMERVLAYLGSSRSEVPLRKLSPSSLHSLLSCSLRFHYQKVAGLQEPEQISGIEMSAQDYGNWVHTGIQLLMEKVAGHGNWIKEEEYEQMEEMWDDFAAEVWMGLPHKTTAGPISEYPVELALAKIMAERFFSHMKKQPEHRWIDNEYEMPDVKIGRENAWWTVIGRADMVLEDHSGFLLLDLKTGGFKDKDKLLLQLDEEGNPVESKMVENKDYFQMICYNRLASEDPGFRGRKVRSSLFYLARPRPELADPFARLSYGEEETAFFERFDAMLLRHLDALSNPALPVEQTKDAATCTFCAFNAMCRR